VLSISLGLGGVDGLVAGVGVGVGEANASTRAAGSVVDSTRGAGSTLLTSSFRLAQPGNKNAVASKTELKPKKFVLLESTRKALLARLQKVSVGQIYEERPVRLNLRLSPASLTVLWFGTAANHIELRNVIS
jgi:hypothetical protein